MNEDAATHQGASMIHRGVAASFMAWLGLAVVLGAGCTGGEVATSGQSALGRWEAMPAVKEFRDVVVDPGGGIWVQRDSGVAWFDGTSLQTPADPLLKGEDRLAVFFGGPDRGAYLTQRGPKENTGLLYRLAGGRATLVTGFSYEQHDDAYAPRLYVSKSGRIFQWGDAFLAEFTGRVWARIEAKWGDRGLSILDAGDTVWFYADRKLYRADANGRLSARDMTAPLAAVANMRYPRAALLGRGTMLLLDDHAKGVWAFDLETGRRVLADRLDLVFADREVRDCVSTADSAVWVLAAEKASDTHRRDENLLYRVSPDGQVERVPETAALGWLNPPDRFSHAVLSAADGSVWFAGGRDVLRWQDGRARVFDWRDGLDLSGNINLFEAPDGRVIAAGDGRLSIFRPDRPTAAPPATLANWTDFRVDRHGLVRDAAGGLWMFRLDRPGEASRWDGAAWRHVPVPFDSTKVERCLGDDRGHLLVQMEGWAQNCYDVSVGGVTPYANSGVLLVAAVAAGVRRFEHSPDFSGCVVGDDGRIWCGYSDQKELSYYDGQQWTELRQAEKIQAVMESPKYGVVTSDYFHKMGICAIRDGKLEPVTELNRKGTRALLGPSGLQPFEEALLDRHPGLYTPIEFADTWELYPLVRTREDGKVHYTRGDRWTGYWSASTPAQVDGFWSGVYEPLREFACRGIPSDLSRTPVRGKDICKIMDDPGHNVWFETYESTGARQVFIEHLDRFRIDVAETPAHSGRTLQVRAEPDLPGLDSEHLRLFWRVDGGAWMGGETGGRTAVRLASPGAHEVQFIGMDPVGGTTPQVVTRRVTADVPLPRTRVMMPGPVTVEDILWTPPVWAVPTDPAVPAEIAYRLGDSGWESAGIGRISMAELKPGVYEFELAACEEGFFLDPKPVQMKVTYAPDPRYVVEKRLAALMGDRPGDAESARYELMLAGPMIVPIIREKLAQGPENQFARETFEKIIEKYAPKDPPAKDKGD